MLFSFILVSALNISKEYQAKEMDTVGSSRLWFGESLLECSIP